MNQYKNRTETINSLKSQAKNRGVIYVSSSNSLVHELTKCLVFYYLKKGYDIDMIENFANSTGFEDLEDSINSLIKISKLKPLKTKRLLLTEAEIGKDKIDLVLADEKLCIEIDYKHPTSKDKIKRLERKGFKVYQIDII